MAPSTIRKAIGAVKDQTSIGIAKVSNNMAVQLEILVVKATSHDEDPADERHIREILAFTAHSKAYLDTCVALISRRLSKTRDWMVALKALLLVHRIVVDGHPSFEDEIVFASRRGMRLLNMSHFRDEAHSNSGDHSSFVRFYAMYLEEKVEFSVFEKRQESGSGSGGGAEDDRRSSPANKEISSIKEMRPERVSARLNNQLRILDRVLACRPAGAARTSRLVLVALYLVLKESFALYREVSEALEVLQERFAQMEYEECLRAFDMYVGTAKLIDELLGHYNWCRDAGIARMSEFPEVQRVSDEVLRSLDSMLKEMSRNRPSKDSPMRIEGQNLNSPVERRSEPTMNEVRALPAPENHTALAPLVEPQPEPQSQHATGELIDLRDDGVSADEQRDKLAVTLFSGAPNATANGSWEPFAWTGQPEFNSAWDTPVADDTKDDWELLLIETASNLAKEKADTASGFDPSLLNGMYNQGAARQHTGADQSSGGGSVATPVVPGEATESRVLALPAPEGTVRPAGPQDPFSASLPPQLPQMLGQEQQMWQGHQVGYYGPVPGNMAMPYGMPQGGGGGGFYYAA
ncbi:hypothetical protein BT93_H0826 [Corymbia citriodora subsp. variegata]|nr:hypothetical protein BT93_H0826 [Corymbia citriodora subsp. variegata]